MGLQRQDQAAARSRAISSDVRGRQSGLGTSYPAAGVIVEDAAAHTTGAGDDVVVLAGIGEIGEQHHEVESTTFRVIANAYAGESSSPPRCCCSSTCSECAEPEERARTIGSGGKKKTLRMKSSAASGWTVPDRGIMETWHGWATGRGGPKRQQSPAAARHASLWRRGCDRAPRCKGIFTHLTAAYCYGVIKGQVKTRCFS